MKIRFCVVVIWIAALFLTACQPAPATAPSVAAPAADSAAQPQPAGNNAQPAAYPAPKAVEAVQAEPTAAGGSMYPGPKSGDEINWDQAQALITNGEVVKVLTGSDAKFTLTLKDGRALILKEPAPGAVQEFIKTCGAPCQAIQTK